MDKLHVIRVKGNVKGEFEHALAPCTLLLGKNAKGKSRVIDALSLALRGEGRSAGLSKKESDLMLLAPDGAGKLYAEAVLSDGRVARWSCEGSTAKASKAVWDPSGAAVEFIYDEAVALLRSDPKKLREALVARMGGTIRRLEIERGIDPIYHDLVLPLFHFNEDGTVAADALAQAAEQIAEQLKEVRARLKRFEASRTAQPEPLTPEEEEELADLEKTASLGGTTPEQLAEVTVACERLEAEHAALQVRLEEVEVAADAVEGIELAMQVHSLMVATLDALRAAGRTECQCICCGQPVTYDLIGTRRDLAAGKIEAATATADAIAARNALEQKERASGAQLQSLRDTLDRMTAAASFDPARLNELRERKLAIMAYFEASGQLATAQQREGVLKGALGGLQSLTATTIDARTADLQRTISATMPKFQTVTLQLRDGTRQVCRLSMVPGKGQSPRDFRALSGAERTMLVAAFASSVVATIEDGRIPIVLVDEVWMDGDSLRALMKTLARAVESKGGPAQAIVAAVSFKGAPPEGWTIIDLDNNETK